MAHSVYGSQHLRGCALQTAVITGSSTWAHLVLRLTLNIICCQFSSYSLSQFLLLSLKACVYFRNWGSNRI